MPRNVIRDSTWAEIRTAYASGIGLREMARKLGIPEGTVLARANREGWTRQIAVAKVIERPKLAGEIARPEAITAITPMQSAAQTMAERGQRHVERMAGVAERVVPHVETLPPAEVLDRIEKVERFDRLARRTYGLDESGGSTRHTHLHLHQHVRPGGA